MSEAEIIHAATLDLPGVSHAFFTRRGGVSEGVYATLNGGVGSRDAPASVDENRARMARRLGVAPNRLAIPFQVHSPDAIVISELWAREARPRCDAIATNARGLAIGVTGADCGILLFADPKAQVIGAAHAGWKGALTGIVEATVAAMRGLGAKASDIRATLGPCIAQGSYEVGPEFVAAFAAAEKDSSRFFIASGNAGRAMFDLHAYIARRVERADVSAFEDLGLDTYVDEERFFSYRRATHRGEADYGRLVAAIALP